MPPQQNVGVPPTNLPLETTPIGISTYPGHLPSPVDVASGGSVPVGQTIDSAAIPSSLGTSPPIVTPPVVNAPMNQPYPPATTLENKPGPNIVVVPSLNAGNIDNKGGSVLVKLPSKDLLSNDVESTEFNSSASNDTVLKINGTLYLLKGSLTKLPQSKPARANQLVGSLLAGVAPKESGDDLINGSEVGLTQGKVMSYKGKTSTILDDDLSGVKAQRNNSNTDDFGRCKK